MHDIRKLFASKRRVKWTTLNFVVDVWNALDIASTLFIPGFIILLLETRGGGGGGVQFPVAPFLKLLTVMSPYVSSYFLVILNV